MTFDVFISYSSVDRTTANALCAALEEQSVRCWIAPRDITPGREWGEAIIEAINDCRLMVLIFSGAANESPQVLREIERAVSKGKAIVPFRIENVAPTRSMEYFLSTPHWLDAITPPLARHLDNLVRTVQAMLGQPVQAVSRSEAAPAPKQASPRPLMIAGGVVAVAVAAVIFLPAVRGILPQDVQRMGMGGPNAAAPAGSGAEPLLPAENHPAGDPANPPGGGSLSGEKIAETAPSEKPVSAGVATGLEPREAVPSGDPVVAEPVSGQSAAQPPARPAARSVAGTIFSGATWQKPELARKALETGAEIVQPDPRGNTALHHAAYYGDPEIVKLLVDAGSPLEARRAEDFSTPLFLAAKRGHAGAVKVLLEAGADVSRVDRAGDTMLHAAVLSGSPEVLEQLLAAGAPPDRTNATTGWTPLHAAAFHNRPDEAGLLLKRGARAGAVDASGKKPLDLASQSGAAKVMELLKQAGSP